MNVTWNILTVLLWIKFTSLFFIISYIKISYFSIVYIKLIGENFGVLLLKTNAQIHTFSERQFNDMVFIGVRFFDILVSWKWSNYFRHVHDVEQLR